MNLSKNLKTLRENRGLTQSDVAKSIETTPQMIGAIERCEKIPSLPLALKLSKLFSINLNDLCEGDCDEN